MAVGGYLYIITNENFPGWVKVGVTKDLDARLNNYQTASPHRNYRLVYSIFHPNTLKRKNVSRKP